MKPTIGELHFDGNCILESPEQHKITFFVQNIPLFSKLVSKAILKECYVNFSNIAKKEEFPYLPVQVFYKKYNIK